MSEDRALSLAQKVLSLFNSKRPAQEVNLPPPNDDSHALERAEAMEQNVTQTRRDEEAMVQLLNRLDRLAISLFEHAQMWDGVNPERAAKVREEHDKVRGLFLQVEQMAESEA